MTVFCQIHHKALAHDRIEQPVQKAYCPGMLHDIPYQKTVIEVYETGIFTFRTDKALQPPIRGMEAVGRMVPPWFQAFCFQKIHQRFLFIDTDMTIFGVVVTFGKCPADSLGQILGNTDNQVLIRLQDPDGFRNCGLLVMKMFQNLRADDKVEIIVPERQVIYVGNRNLAHPAAVFSEPFLVFKPALCLKNIIKVDVHSDGNDVSEPKSTAGVPPRSASDIQNTAAGGYVKPVKVDGNHGWSPCRPQQSFLPPFSR